MECETICYIKNNQYIAKPMRTYILFDNFINEIKVSYFDILNISEYSKTLILNINQKRKLIIKSDNIKFLFRYVGPNHGRMLLFMSAASLSSPKILIYLKTVAETNAMMDLLKNI